MTTSTAAAGPHPVTDDLDAVEAWALAAEAARSLSPRAATIVAQLVDAIRAAAAAGGIAPSVALSLHQLVEHQVRADDLERPGPPVPVYDPPRLLTIAQAAVYLGRSADTLRDWEDSGRLLPTCHTTGGHRRYDSAELDRRRAELTAPRTRTA